MLVRFNRIIYFAKIRLNKIVFYEFYQFIDFLNMNYVKIEMRFEQNRSRGFLKPLGV